MSKQKISNELLERIDFAALKHIEANDKEEAKQKFEMWWQTQIPILAENFMRTLPAGTSSAKTKAQWQKSIGIFANAAKQQIAEINNLGVKYIKESSLYNVLAKREEKNIPDDFFWRFDRHKELQLNILDYLDPRFIKFTADAQNIDLSHVFNRLSHFSCGQETLMFPVDSWARNSYNQMVIQWYTDPDYSEESFEQDFSKWWPACLHKIDSFLFAVVENKTQLRLMLEKLFPQGVNQNFYEQQWPILRKAYCKAFLQTINTQATTTVLARKALSKDEYSAYADSRKESFLLRKLESTLQDLQSFEQDFTTDMLTDSTDTLSSLLTYVSTTGRSLIQYNNETDKEDDLTRVFSSHPKGRESLQIFPLHADDFLAISKLSAKNSQGLRQFYTQNTVTQEAHNQLIPDDDQLRTFLASAELMDPRGEAKNWFTSYFSRLNGYLYKIDEITGKYYLELILDRLFPEQAGKIEMYAEYSAPLKEAFFRACHQALIEEAIEVKEQDYVLSASNYQMKNVYIVNLFKILIKNIPYTEPVSLSPYTQQQSTQNHLATQAQITSKAEEVAVAELNPTSTSPLSPAIKPLSEEIVTEDDLIRAIISNWWGKRAISVVKSPEWAEFQIVNFDRYLFSIVGEKFIIQHELDKIHKKSDKTPYYEHYIKYKKDFYERLMQLFISELAEKTGCGQDELVQYHTQYMDDIKNEENESRRFLIEDLSKLFKEEKADKTLVHINKRYHFLEQISTRVISDLGAFFDHKGERHSPVEYNSLKEKILATVQTEAEEVLETKPKKTVIQKLVLEFKKTHAALSRIFDKAKERDKNICIPEEAPKRAAVNLSDIKGKVEEVLEKHKPIMNY